MSSPYRCTVARITFTVAMSVGCVSAAWAQSTVVPDASATMTKAEARAAARQARKAHRAAKNLELAKLEAAGYDPAVNDPDYPVGLEAAQKKAGLR